jgi:hypothetical protein
VGLSKLAVNQDQTRAFWGYCQQANDQGEGYMTAFDLSSFAVLNSTAMTYGAQDFVYQESTGKIYVAGFWTGGSNPGYLPVLEWDVSSYGITDQLSVSGSSDQAALALNPADADILYLTDGDANTLYQLSIASGEVTNQVAFNKAAMEPMTIIAGDGIGYVVSLYSDLVVKVDLATARFKGSFTLPEGISGMIAGGYNDGKIYFCQNGIVYEVNAQTGSLIRTIDTGTDAASGNITFYGDNAVMLDLYPGGMTGRRLLYFSADDMSLIDTVALSEELYGDRVMASPDGSKLYYTRGPSIGGDAYIDIVNAATREVADTITIASVDVHTRGCSSFVDAYFDTANRRAYILGWGSVYVVDMDSNTLLDILDTNDVRNSEGEEYAWVATALSGVTVNTDGNVLLISAGDSHCVYFYDLTNTAWLTDVVNLNGYFPCDATAYGSYFYTVNRLTDSLSVVDRSTLSLDKTMDLTNPDQTDLTPPLLLLMDNGATAD